MSAEEGLRDEIAECREREEFWQVLAIQLGGALAAEAEWDTAVADHAPNPLVEAALAAYRAAIVGTRP